MGDNYLVALATIGMTLGGFTGLINAFRAAGRDWQSQERAGMKMIFEHSLAAVFFGILPFPIFHSPYLKEFVWLISSALLGCFLLFEFASQAVQVARMTKAGTPPRRPLPLLLHFFPFTLTALVLQVANFYWQEDWPYFWGLFWLLQPPAIQFYHFISFMKVKTDEPNDSQPKDN